MTSGSSPSEGPRLLDCRDQVRDVLSHRYRPHAVTMGFEDGLKQFFADAVGQQSRYEQLAVAITPEQRIAGRYSAHFHAGQWYPEPVEYVSRWVEIAVAHGLFETPLARRAARQLIRKHGCPPEQIEAALEDVLRDAVCELAASHERPATKKRLPSNDLAEFLRAWAAALNLPVPRQVGVQGDLIAAVANNPYRREKRRVQKFTTGHDPAYLELVGAFGELVEGLDGLSIEAFLDSEAELTDAERTAVGLKFEWPGKTFEEVAEVMGVSPAQAYKLFHSGIQKLQAKYAFGR